MQFGCESCKAQLQIADEKVRGKRLIVRCKRCGAKISISDPALGPARPRVAGAPGSAPPPVASAPPPTVSAAPRPAAKAAPIPRDSDTDSTRAMDSDLLEQALQASKEDEPTLNTAPSADGKAASPDKPAPPAADPMWFAMLHGKQTGPLTRAELGARTDEGAVGPRTYLWKDGMNAWQRAKDLPELEGLFPQLPDPPRLPPPVAPPPIAPMREFSSPDFVGRPQPAEAVRPGKPAAAAAQAANGPTPAEPLPPGDRVHQEGVARELLKPEKGPAQKPADLASWAAGELEKKSSPPRPSTTPVPRMFEGAVEPRSRGPFVLVVLGVVAIAAVVLWFVFEPKPEPPPAIGLTADQVRQKLDENKGALQGCIDEALRRDPNLRVGKIHIATRIAPTGVVTQAKIDKNTVDQSPLGACLRGATKKIAFPSFGGEAFDVDIPIVVTAGE